MRTKDRILFYYVPLLIAVFANLTFLKLRLKDFLTVALLFVMGYLFMSLMDWVTKKYKNTNKHKLMSVFVIMIGIVCAGGLMYWNLLIG